MRNSSQRKYTQLDLKDLYNRLQGKPTSRLRPEFVILDPQQQPTTPAETKAQPAQTEATRSAEAHLQPPGRFTQLLSPALQRKFRRAPPRPASGATVGASSESETEESCVSTPRLQRRFGAARKHQHNHHQATNHNAPLDAEAKQQQHADVSRRSQTFRNAPGNRARDSAYFVSTL